MTLENAQLYIVAFQMKPDSDGFEAVVKKSNEPLAPYSVQIAPEIPNDFPGYQEDLGLSAVEANAIARYLNTLGVVALTPQFIRKSQFPEILARIPAAQATLLRVSES